MLNRLECDQQVASDFPQSCGNTVTLLLTTHTYTLLDLLHPSAPKQIKQHALTHTFIAVVASVH